MEENKSPNWRDYLPFVLLMSGAYLLYQQVFSAAWLMDDLNVVVNNPDIRSIGNFLENYYPGRPLRELSYLIDYRFFELNHAGYFIQNIFWHGLSSWLLFQLARKIGCSTPVAWASTLIFLMHPVQVEVVANISHRKDSLALAFCLLSFWAYLHARSSATSRRQRWFLGAFLLWLVALVAKQNALALPMVIVAYELYCWPRDGRQKLVIVSICILIGTIFGRLAYLINDQSFKDSIAPALNKLANFTSGTIDSYFLAVCKSWAFMFSKLVYPVHLSMEYTFPIPSLWSDPWVLCGILILAFVTLGFVWAWRSALPVYLALAWFLAFWLPTSNLLGHLSYFVADRYWYAPLAGIALLVAYAFWKLCRGNLLVYGVVFSVILTGLGLQTWRQQGFWCDAEVFYSHMHQVNPDALEGLIGLGTAAMDRGEYLNAQNYFKRAFQRSPLEARVIQNLGYIAHLQGDYNTAVSYFRQALAIDPKLIEVYNNLGSAYDDLGQTGKAIDIIERGLEINSHYEKLYSNLGVIYERIGEFEKAEELQLRALRERPGYGQAHLNLGTTLYRAGRKAEALQSYSRAVQLLPDNLDALYNYAVVANELGSRETALSTLAKLKAIDPQLADELQRELR